MTDESNKALDILVKKMVSVAKSVSSNLKYDKTFKSTIWKINSDNTYSISYKNKLYDVPNATAITLSLGQTVFVTIPSGIFRNMYISGALTK